MADGSITFATDIDNSEVKKGMNEAKREIDKAMKGIKDAEAAKLPLVEEVDKLKVKLQEARRELEFFKEEQAGANAAMLPGADLEDYMAASERLPGFDQAVADQQKQVDSLEKEWDQVNSKISKYDQKIAQANATISQQQDRVKALSAQLIPDTGSMEAMEKTTAGAASNTSAMAAATKRASVSAEHFRKRMVGVVKQVFVFGLVSKALYATVEYMGKALKTNKQFTAELARLKGALLTAFQPIYETLLPVLLAIMKIVTAVAQAIAHVFSLISGKSASHYAANAKALYEQANATEELGKAAKKAQKSLAAFDEINRLDSAEDDVSADTPASSTTTPDFSDFDTGAFKQKIDELTVYISAAALVLGVILLFSGANIPLGLGLIALGAIGLATEIKEDWDTVKRILEEKSELIAGISGLLLVLGMVLAFSGANIPLGIGLISVGAAGLAAVAVVNWEMISQKLQGSIGTIVAVTSTLLLVLGMVLTFSGANIPLGIGLMIAGAAGLATTAAANWNTIVEKLRGPIGSITAATSTVLLAIGIILVCTGFALPLGIALIAAGAAGLVTVAAVNWDRILECIRGVWEKIKQWWGAHVAPVFTKKYWTDKFSTMKDALVTAWKTAINKVIGLVNRFVGWVNDKMHLKWDALTIAGYQITPAVDYQLFRIPTIPYLAQGAVLPANKPFLAMVGDQKHGTNVEAPLATIQEAVAIVMEDMIASNMAGHEATVAVLREILSAVMGIEIGDSTIGRAVERYDRQMAVIRGGV